MSIFKANIYETKTENVDDNIPINGNLSLLELSSDVNLKVNIINNNEKLVEHFREKLKNKNKESRKIYYFDMDITEDVHEITDAFCSPLEFCEHSEINNFDYRLKKFMSLFRDVSYVKKILLNPVRITVHE